MRLPATALAAAATFAWGAHFLFARAGDLEYALGGADDFDYVDLTLGGCTGG